MAGRRRGARSGRGWDALPPRADPPRKGATGAGGTPARRAAGERAAAEHAATEHAGPPKEPGELAREICLELLAARPRTRAELASALRRRGIAAEVAAEVLDRYDEVGIVDDAAFARAWVSSRHHSKGLARRALAGELRRRGVDDETVRDAVEELDGETEAETARELVDRKLRTSSAKDPAALVRKLVGMLARKGYSPGLAYRVVKEALEEHGGQAAEFADHIDADALADTEAAIDGEAAMDGEAAIDTEAAASGRFEA